MNPGHNVRVADWRKQLPVLGSQTVTLREPVASDLLALVSLLTLADSSRFGIEAASDIAVSNFIVRVQKERAAGVAFTFAIFGIDGTKLAGIVQVRQLDAMFEGAEWDWTLAPEYRGTGVFLDAARLVASFAFGTVGAHRLEARVLLRNGRANGALRKLGAVQEGILRRAVRRDDEYVDQALWSILDEDWTDDSLPGAASVVH